ncbi:MAG: immunoglobulin domain-containing protein [Verrucomicrobiae bacterium]|nr:immunoglobulin domain-containing protein [Verrucomicrobiae bacterium]
MHTTFKQLTAIIALLHLGMVGPLQAGVVVESPGAIIAGKTIGEWTAAWWQWAVALSPPGDPFTDTTGEFAGVNQSGPVFFLAGSPDGSRGRQFQVPSDKYILVPLLAGEWSQLELGFDKSAAEIRQAAQQQADQINSLHATLDGAVISQATLFTHREASPDFSFVAAAGNSVNVPPGDSGVAVADGYFLMLAPLSPGTHVLSYGGGASSLGISISETDTITAVGPPPTITGQPSDQAVFIGSNATFSVSAMTTNPPLRFQWQFNGVDLPDATNDALTIFNAQVVNTGGYSVVITDRSGFTNSSVAYLTLLNLPPSISTQPTNLVVVAGTTATFSVNAEGTMPLFFQWFFNEAKLDGATSSTLAVTNTQSHHVGQYTVVITNTYGAITSSVAALRLLAWTQIYNGPANDYDAFGFPAFDVEGNIFVVGISCTNINDCDHYVAKYAAGDGALLWEHRYNSPGSEAGSLTAMAIDSNGDVLVTGSFGNWGTNDFITAKLSGADGALLWEKRYDGPGNGNDYPYALAVDGSGNVVVAGTSENGPPNYGSSSCTIKYAAADGALLWEKRYNSPANTIDEARAVAVDGNGDVVVTGASYNADINSDYYTAKYSGANGALLWERRYISPVNGEDYPTALALDQNGDVVVTGVSSASNLLPDYYTAKYAGTNGALLWERRYNGPGNYFDLAEAVAVDQFGNVVVTGQSANGEPQFDFDYYTAKYAVADGSLLWAKRYSGPASSSEGAREVALDINGDVLVLGDSGGDTHLLAYAADDGATMWDYRHGNSYVSGLAVDNSGGIILAGTTSSTDSLLVKILASVPRAAIPRFTSITSAEGSVQLEWTTAPGVAVYQTPSLSAPDWQIVAGSQNTNRITISATNASGFFKLVKP